MCRLFNAGLSETIRQGEPLTPAQSEDPDLETLKHLLIMNTSTTVRESRLSERMARAKQAAELAYQDALAESKCRGLPMMPPVKAAKVSKHKKAAR